MAMSHRFRLPPDRTPVRAFAPSAVLTQLRYPDINYLQAHYTWRPFHGLDETWPGLYAAQLGIGYPLSYSIGVDSR